MPVELAPMRYKSYTWPHNPRVYSIEYERKMSCQKVPYGHYHLQDLGVTRRVMRGEGEFVGPDAYQEFKKLASVFYQDGPGLLVHPVWQTSYAYFAELSLAQEPKADYVRYTFAFWEAFGGYETTLKLLPPPAAEEVQETGGTEENGSIFEEEADGQYLNPLLPNLGALVGAIRTRQSGLDVLWHTVNTGETIWTLEEKYETPATEILRMNPHIKNPNELKVGERVRVR